MHAYAIFPVGDACIDHPERFPPLPTCQEAERLLPAESAPASDGGGVPHASAQAPNRATMVPS